jgi:hypothetical protein
MFVTKTTDTILKDFTSLIGNLEKHAESQVKKISDFDLVITKTQVVKSGLEADVIKANATINKLKGIFG